MGVQPEERQVAHVLLAGLEALESTATPTALPTQVSPIDGEWPFDVQSVRSNAEAAFLVGLLEDAIDYWCAAYQVSCADLHSIAECESRYGRDPNAYNGSSGFWGAFQFHPDTWLSTPPGQRGELATGDWAAAEGAAWMISVGRRGEWPSC